MAIPQLFRAKIEPKAKAQPKEGLQTCFQPVQKGLRLQLKAKRHNRFFPYDKFTVLKWPLKRNKKNRTTIYAGYKPAQMAVPQLFGAKIKAKARAKPKAKAKAMAKAKAKFGLGKGKGQAKDQG